MRRIQSTLLRQDVCHLAVNVLLSAVKAAGLIWSSASFSLVSVLEVLLRASAEGRSLDAIAHLAGDLPSAETIRKGLLTLLPRTTGDLEPLIVPALHKKLPKSLARRPRLMAIDLHTKPYYGDKKTPGIYRGQRKASTKTFFAYATLLVLRKGVTFTVGLVAVVNGEDLTTIINRLLQQAAQKGLRPRALLLDRGFYAAKVMLLLQAQNIPFVMPMICRGKSGKTKEECTGTAQFFVKGRRGWAEYTWEARLRTQGRKGPRTRVTTEVCMAPRSNKGDKETAFVFACYRMKHRTPKEIAELYRRRFRIETSYRQMHECLAMTCSKNAVYRLLLVLIALVLRNLWVWLHWTLFADRDNSGQRILHLERMRVRTMLHHLLRYLDDRLAIPGEVDLPNAAATIT